MTTIAEQIYALVKTLPSAQASEVLVFAEMIRAKLSNSQANHPIKPQVAPSTSFKASLNRLHELTQDLSPVDPVDLIRAGREELDERC